jgi:tetratricopeptide (TPR) repeat protein
LKIVQDLVERGADLCLEVEGKTPLYLAFEQSKWEVVNWLRGKMPNHSQVESRWKEEADRMTKNKVESDRERADEIKNIGNKYYVAKEYPQALEEYTKALSFDQSNVPIDLFRR